MSQNHLEQIGGDLVARATRAGATAADVVVREGEEFSSSVRLGKIENLKEAASKVLGLRVFLSKARLVQIIALGHHSLDQSIVLCQQSDRA